MKIAFFAFFVFFSVWSLRPDDVFAQEQGQLPESTLTASEAQNQPNADACSALRLDDEPSKSMFQVVVHDQGRDGICYAEAAAQMTDAFRFGVRKETDYGYQTAPAVAAIKSSDLATKAKDPFKGGYTCQVIDYIRREGSHDNSIFQSCRKRLTALKAHQFDSIFDDYQAKIYEKRSQLEAEDSLQKSRKELHGFAISVAAQKQSELANCAASAGSAIPDLTGARAQVMPSLTVLQTYFEQSRDAFRSEMISYACATQDVAVKLPDLPQCHPLRLGSGATAEQLLKKIDDQFKTHPQLPTAIGYCDQILRKGRSYSGLEAGNANPASVFCTAENTDENSATGRHESLIIGRRRDLKGNCQYLIRNSWGKSCLKKATPKSTEAVSKYSADWECEEGKGSLWVDRESLGRSLFEVSYLK